MSLCFLPVNITQTSPWHQNFITSAFLVVCLSHESQVTHQIQNSFTPSPGKLWLRNTRRLGKAQQHEAHVLVDRYTGFTEIDQVHHLQCYQYS